MADLISSMALSASVLIPLAYRASSGSSNRSESAEIRSRSPRIRSSSARSSSVSGIGSSLSSYFGTSSSVQSLYAASSSSSSCFGELGASVAGSDSVGLSRKSSISMVSAASITLSAVASSASAVFSSVWTFHSLSSVLWRSAVDSPSFISACRRVSVGYSEAGVGVKESLPPSVERSPSVFLAMVLSETGLPVFSSYHLPSSREYCLLFQARLEPSVALRMLSFVSSASSGTSAEDDSAPSRRSSICLLSRELPSASAQELSPCLVYLPSSEVNTVPVGYDPALGRLLLELRALSICSSDMPGALSRSALTSIISMVEG